MGALDRLREEHEFILMVKRRMEEAVSESAEIVERTHPS